MYARSSQVEPSKKVLAVDKFKYSFSFPTTNLDYLSCSIMILILWTSTHSSKKVSMHAVDPQEVRAVVEVLLHSVLSAF